MINRAKSSPEETPSPEEIREEAHDLVEKTIEIIEEWMEAKPLLPGWEEKADKATARSHAVLARNLKKARLKQKLTAAEVARRAEIPTAEYEALERGDRKTYGDLSLDTFYRLAIALEIKPHELAKGL